MKTVIFRCNKGFKQQLLRVPVDNFGLPFQLYPSEFRGKASNQFLDKLLPGIQCLIEQ
jgi:hypothetical protein